jgi:undecaprenyl-diphosphatase
VFRYFVSLWRSIKEAVIRNPDTQALVQKYPRSFSFARKRLERNVPSGRPLTVIFGTFLGSLVLFGGILQDVVASDPIVGVDLRIETLLAVFRTPGIAGFFVWVTLLGEGITVAGILAGAALLFYLGMKRSYMAGLFVSVLGSELMSHFIKILVHRPRPGGSIPFFTESSFSFPSGHATVAVALYGFLAYFFLKNFRRGKGKALLAFMLAIILGIGFSRLYLGVHFLSDVWGGYLLGALWLIIAIAFTEWLGRKESWKEVLLPEARVRSLSALLVFVLASFYIGIGLTYRIDTPAVPPPVTITVGSTAPEVVQALDTNTLPKYSEDILANVAEPLNIIIIAPGDEALAAAFKDAGWQPSDKVTARSFLKSIKAAFLKEEYPTAPMTPAFWYAQVNDFGFEKTLNGTIRQRHHLRMWKSPLRTTDGKIIYVGDASYDTGVKWGITHTIAPDIDTERELVLADLKNSPLLIDYSKVHLVAPTLGKNFTGDVFFTDGDSYIVELR